MNALDLFSFTRYLLIVAHPDDEVNCAVLLHRLLAKNIPVKIIVLTNGDAGINAAGRPAEMIESVRNIGVDNKDLHFLNIAEKELLDNAVAVYEDTLRIAAPYKADCILSLDYEGGHEGHDLASFIAHKVAQETGAAHIVFPDYHFRNMHRHGLEFQPGRHPDHTIELTDDEKNLKIRLLEAHRGQLGFYLRLQRDQENYFSLLFDREVYRNFPDNFDFLARPNYEIGYEHHRNGFKFPNVVNAIKSIP